MNEQIASMYEVAIRKKIRFASQVGSISLEQLWDVPLRSRSGLNLDAVAKAAAASLKELGEDSFVSTRKSTKQTEAELRLDFVKHVINVKLEEEAAAAQRANNKKEKEKLLAALEKKQDSKLENMSEAAIKRKLAELGA